MSLALKLSELASTILTLILSQLTVTILTVMLLLYRYHCLVHTIQELWVDLEIR